MAAWRGFIDYLPQHEAYELADKLPTDRYPTIYTMLDNVSPQLAWCAQGLGLAVAVALVAYAFLRTRDFFARSFALAVAYPLATPFLLEYDLAFWSLPAAMLAARLWREEGSARDWIALVILAALPTAAYLSSLANVNVAALGVFALLPIAIAHVRAAPALPMFHLRAMRA